MLRDLGRFRSYIYENSSIYITPNKKISNKYMRYISREGDGAGE